MLRLMMWKLETESRRIVRGNLDRTLWNLFSNELRNFEECIMYLMVVIFKSCKKYLQESFPSSCFNLPCVKIVK